MAWPGRPEPIAPGENSSLGKGRMKSQGRMRKAGKPNFNQGDTWRWRNKGRVMRKTLRPGGDSLMARDFSWFFQSWWEV